MVFFVLFAVLGDGGSSWWLWRWIGGGNGSLVQAHSKAHIKIIFLHPRVPRNDQEYKWKLFSKSHYNWSFSMWHSAAFIVLLYLNRYNKRLVQF